MTTSGERPVATAMLRGWGQRCPNCGGGPLFESYLKVRDTCAACGEELHHHRADDMPAWATILIVGHVIIGGMVTAETMWSLPLWVHWTLWPVLALISSLWLLPRIKGAVVGMQWAWMMHGFSRKEDQPE
ncbi:MAG: DUF983 domain-containing protein [Pseudomonadota bacterium]